MSVNDDFRQIAKWRTILGSTNYLRDLVKGGDATLYKACYNNIIAYLASLAKEQREDEPINAKKILTELCGKYPREKIDGGF